MKKRLYKFIFFTLMGWKIEGNFDKTIKKCVFIVVPHTSWHDFYIGILTRGVLNIEINFIGKKELFIFPFGYFFRFLGGAPVDRHSNQNRVDSIVNVFQKREIFRLALSPEGTRKKVNSLRTGFYYIALNAKVPIVPITFDFKTKTVKINQPFIPTNNLESDMKILDSNFVEVTGKIPELGYVPKFS